MLIEREFFSEIKTEDRAWILIYSCFSRGLFSADEIDERMQQNLGNLSGLYAHRLFSQTIQLAEVPTSPGPNSHCSAAC